MMYKKSVIDKLFPDPPEVLHYNPHDESPMDTMLREEMIKNNKVEFFLNNNSIIITPDSIAKLEPGKYAFIQRPGENFLRIDKKIDGSHKFVGKGMDMISAGEIHIRKNSKGESYIFMINNQSSHYIPPKSSLNYALKALIDQHFDVSSIRIDSYETTIVNNLGKQEVFSEQFISFE